jgi:hypothetical protein
MLLRAASSLLGSLNSWLAQVCFPQYNRIVVDQFMCQYAFPSVFVPSLTARYIQKTSYLTVAT